MSTDPVKLGDFVANPEAAMAASSLDEPGRRALRSRSATGMWDLLLGRPANGIPDADPIAPDPGPRKGSLTVIGTGIRTVGQLTLEAITWLKHADIALYLVADPVAEEAIRLLNPKGAMSLRGYYGEGVHRGQSYEAMVQHMLSCVRAGFHLRCLLWAPGGLCLSVTRSDSPGAAGRLLRPHAAGHFGRGLLVCRFGRRPGGERLPVI